jgi:hypothetical protein
MAGRSASRISSAKVLADLRRAGRKGDPTALALALDAMRTLAHSPRYWEKYLALLRNPFARLVDLLVVKQGERIAYQKGWKRPAVSAASRERGGGKKAKGRPATARPPRRPRGTPGAGAQPSLFD